MAQFTDQDSNIKPFDCEDSFLVEVGLESTITDSVLASHSGSPPPIVLPHTLLVHHDDDSDDHMRHIIGIELATASIWVLAP